MESINTYSKYGTRWKPGKDSIHLKKKFARRDLPMEFTLDEYNRLIINIIMETAMISKNPECYLAKDKEYTYVGTVEGGKNGASSTN